MKTFKIILAALIATGTASSCNKNSRQVDNSSPLKDSPIAAQHIATTNGDTMIVCNLASLKDTIDFPLSTFISDFQLIDLDEDEDALIKETSGSGPIAVSNNYIGIYSDTGYKLFDKTGRYITSLSSRGEGPNEYTISIYDSYIDEQNNRVYLLPMSGNKILVYDLKGNVQPYIPLARETTKGKFRVDAEKGLIYLTNMPFSDTASVFWMQDFEGKLIKEIIAGHLSIVPPDFSNEINASMNTEKIDYSLFHWIEKPDTLYHYNEAENRLTPSFTVNFKDKPIQHDYIELPDYYIIRLIETEPNYRYTYGLIDKHTLKGNYIKLKLDMLGNIDAPAWMQFGRGFYNANIYAYYLQEQCRGIVEQSSLPSGIAKYIQDLQQSDSEDLNNIILIGKLKKSSTESFTMLNKDYKKQSKTMKTLSENSSLEKSNTPIKKDKTSSKNISTSTEATDSDRVYGWNDLKDIAEVPQLKGSIWKEYLRKNNRYKDWNSKDPRETMIEFIVEKNGKTSNVTVKESSGNPELDKEAVRIVKESEWTVGKLKNNKEIRLGNMMCTVFFPAQ